MKASNAAATSTTKPAQQTEPQHLPSISKHTSTAMTEQPPLATPELIEYYRGFIHITQAAMKRMDGLEKCRERLRKLGRLNAICVAHLEKQGRKVMTAEDWEVCWGIYNKEKGEWQEEKRGERGEKATEQGQ